MGMTQTSTNYATIGTKAGQTVGSANSESLAEAHQIGAHWLRAGVADTYEIWADGARRA
jgi:hypothetical protein